MKSARKKFSIEQAIKTSKFNYVKNFKWFLIAPIMIAVVGMILLFTIGFNTGIDFTGGTIIQVVPVESQYNLNNQDDYNVVKSKVDSVLSVYEITGSMYQTSETDVGLAILVRYKDIDGKTDAEMNAINDQVISALRTEFGFSEHDVPQRISGNQRIGATASSELIMNVFLAILVSVALILIYIVFRFEFTSGMATILTIFHDVIITASLMLILRVQINASFVAALITVVGYSINNTIIIFDRIRENSIKPQYAEASNAEIANVSIKETMMRSINTTLTTLLTISMVAIIGVDAIREFAIPILVGIMAGFYSSVFIAPSLWVVAYKKGQWKFKWFKKDSKPEDGKKKKEELVV